MHRRERAHLRGRHFPRYPGKILASLFKLTKQAGFCFCFALNIFPDSQNQIFDFYPDRLSCSFSGLFCGRGRGLSRPRRSSACRTTPPIASPTSTKVGSREDSNENSFEHFLFGLTFLPNQQSDGPSYTLINLRKNQFVVPLPLQ